MRKRRIPKSFVPKECTYRLWRKRFDVKPKHALVKYWEVDKDSGYCGVLYYPIDILTTIMLIVILFTLYHNLLFVNKNVINIECPKSISLENNTISLNVNNVYSSNDVKCELLYKNNVIYSSVIKSGSSIGTVDTKINIAEGDYPVILRFTMETDNVNKTITDEQLVLLVVNK